MSFLRFSAAFLGRAFAEISIHECSQRRDCRGGIDAQRSDEQLVAL